jgi:hypothetical protein
MLKSRGPENKPSVLFVEPNCEGLEHIPFNSALLEVVGRTWPNLAIVRVAERRHLEFLQRRRYANFANHTASDIPLVNLERQAKKFFGQLNRCILIVTRLARLARHVNAQIIIFSSISPYMFTILRVANLLIGRRRSIFVFFHYALRDIRSERPRFSDKWLGLRTQLTLNLPSNMKIIVLGESIKRNAVRFLGAQNATRLKWIHHPYLIAETPINPKIRSFNPVVFSYIGAAKEGFREFCSIAAIFRGEQKCRFVHIGRGSEIDLDTAKAAGVHGTQTEPLDEDRMSELLSGTHFVIGTEPPERYELVASGTFIDAIARGIPGIYIKNDFLEYYFNLFGDVGYLCSSAREIENTVRRILFNLDIDRYHLQVDRIVSARHQFSVAQVSNQLSGIAQTSASTH